MIFATTYRPAGEVGIITEIYYMASSSITQDEANSVFRLATRVGKWAYLACSGLLKKLNLLV